jgi:hypothetical protein
VALTLRAGSRQVVVGDRPATTGRPVLVNQRPLRAATANGRK